jgi:hypothetical protein
VTAVTTRADTTSMGATATLDDRNAERELRERIPRREWPDLGGLGQELWSRADRRNQPRPSSLQLMTTATWPAGLVFRVSRSGPGTPFVQWRPDPTDPPTWAWETYGAAPVPYHLAAVADPTTAGPVPPLWLTEGAKDAPPPPACDRSRPATRTERSAAPPSPDILCRPRRNPSRR